MLAAREIFGRPGISIMLPAMATTKPAPLERLASVTLRVQPVGAPIFFRDVPLMPNQSDKGVIKPLPPEAIRLIKWRLRYVDELATAQDRSNAITEEIKQLNEATTALHEKFAQSTKGLAAGQ